MATSGSQVGHGPDIRSGPLKPLDNEGQQGSLVSRSSEPSTFTLILGSVGQVGGVGSLARVSMERSSRLLPLRQAIMGNNSALAQPGGGDGEEAPAVGDFGAPDNGSWLGSSLILRAKCNGDEGEDSLREESSLHLHFRIEGSATLDVNTRPAHSMRPVCSALPPPAEEATKHIGMWRDFFQHIRQQQKVCREVALGKWWIMAMPLLLCLLLVALGVFGVVYASARYTEHLRDYAREALASTAISTVAGQLEIATFAVMTLSAYLTQQPNCAQLDLNYNKLGNVIFQWDAKQAVYQLQAMPAAVVKYIHPYPDPDLAQQLIGRDILELPQYRNDTIRQIQARDQRLLLGPYNLVEGFKAMFVTFAVFLPAPDPMYDWGCGVQPHECPPDTCWVPDPANKTAHLKLWGMATSLVRLDVLKKGFGFNIYEQQGYCFRLKQLRDDINREAIIDESSEPPENPVTLKLEKYNLQWEFEVAPAGGWVPVWRNPCIAAVVVGSVVVSALVLWLLLTREKHKLLLKAMLPRKVIRQLQRGQQTVVEEYHDPVTILFTDIVSYTEVASQLTPLQVVRLLNDLYTEFDALTDKHGVYKVETIGDAFMCVSGCPRREEPVQAAVRMAGMAQDMISLVERFVSRVSGEEMKVKIRIGLHSGPVVAGVIGQRMPRYCLFGDTVNTASRMESNSAPMCINVSSATAELLRAGGAVVVPYNPPTPMVHLTPMGIRAKPSTPSPPRPPLSQTDSKPRSHIAELLSRAPSQLVPPLRPPPLQPSPLVLRGVPQPKSPQALEQQQQQHIPLPSPPPLLQQQLMPPQQQPGCDADKRQKDGCDKDSSSSAGGSSSTSNISGGISERASEPLVLHSRGVIHIKGKGPMLCYWLGHTPCNSLN